MEVVGVIVELSAIPHVEVVHLPRLFSHEEMNIWMDGDVFSHWSASGAFRRNCGRRFASHYLQLGWVPP